MINLIALFIVLGGQAIALSGRGSVRRDDLAPGAVTARNLAKGAVVTSKLARHAVGAGDLGRGAVVGRTLASGSVDGRSLVGTIQVPATIPDLDPVTHENDFAWTTSGGSASCPAGAIRLGGGLRLQDSASHRAFLQSSFPSSTGLASWIGEISTDTGGASPALLLALCLR